jgi:phenylpropionate dioxygenase-like ring-hydroxylating dioxygenase large terminal subunit
MLADHEARELLTSRKPKYALEQPLYTDPGVFDADLRMLFYRDWLLAIPSCEIPKTGNFVTMQVGAYPVVIVRGADGQIRAFHNVCRHRGNKLVWNDFPQEETAGSCKQFTCKYHAWRYSLEGELTFVQQEGEFFDLDKKDYGLKDVRCETW